MDASKQFCSALVNLEVCNHWSKWKIYFCHKRVPFSGDRFAAFFPFSWQFKCVQHVETSIYERLVNVIMIDICRSWMITAAYCRCRWSGKKVWFTCNKCGSCGGVFVLDDFPWTFLWTATMGPVSCLCGPSAGWVGASVENMKLSKLYGQMMSAW